MIKMEKIKLSIKQLNKVFGDARQEALLVLSDIDLQVKEKEFAVIVGPSGCGKSTLLNIVGGLEMATSGTVEVDGKIVTKPGADRGMVFQGYSLFPWLSVQKNIEFGLKMKGISKELRNETAKKYIEIVGLCGFENAMPNTLSGGMKQRVAIARTLANEPSLLLMDEPFGALDAQTRVVMQELLAQVCKKTQTTVLFITHDIDEAILLGNKIYVMSRRPGTIKAVLDVDIQAQRNHNMLVLPEFLTLKKEIMEMLWKESNDAALDK